MERKNPFYSLPEADLADRNGFTDASIVAGKQDSLEYLDTLFLALTDLDVNLDLISRLKLFDGRLTMSLFNFFNHRVLHVISSRIQ